MLLPVRRRSGSDLVHRVRSAGDKEDLGLSLVQTERVSTWMGEARHSWLPGAASQLERHRRTLFWLVIFPAATFLIVTRLDELNRAVVALKSVQGQWLLAAMLASASIYLMAAWAQMGAVSQSLAFGRTVIVQIAATFVAQLTPQGIGGMGLNERYLEKEGLERPAAVGAVTLNMVVGAVVHVIALLVVFTLLGRTVAGHFSLLEDQRVVLALALAAAGAVVAAYTYRDRLSIPQPIHLAVQSTRQVLRQPNRTLALIAGSVGITGAYSLTLILSLLAFGVHISPLQVIAVYLGSAAVGALMPTPGGLGAMEGALVAGLAAVGVGFGPALAAVSTFRLLTFWLPILPGFVAFRYLQQRQII